MLPRRLIERAVWVLASILFGRGFVVLSGVVLARTLGNTSFGELSAAQLTVTFPAFVVGYGLGQTGTKILAECRNYQSERGGAVFGIYLAAVVSLLAIPAIVMFGWIASSTIPNTSHLFALSYSLIGVALSSIALLACQGLLAGLDDYRGLAVISMLGGLLTLAGALFAATTATVEAAAAVLSAANVFSAIAIYLTTVRHLASRQTISREALKRRFSALFIRFTVPRALYGALPALVSWGSVAILAALWGDFADVGVFSAADQWFLVTMVIPAALCGAAFPSFASQWILGKRYEAISLFWRVTSANAALVAVACTALFLCTPILILLYGSSFAGYESTFKASFIAAAIAAIQVPGQYFLAAVGRAWLSFVLTLAGTVATLTSAVHFVGDGSYGVASARIVGFSVQASLTAYVLFKIVWPTYRQRSGTWFR